MDRRNGPKNNVLAMVTKDKSFRFPAIAQVDAYWEGLRDGRQMPSRGEVDPRGLDGALEFAMMLESIAPGVARIRVAGMHLCDILGMEVRGMPLTSFFEPAARAQISGAVEQVIKGPRVADILLNSTGGIGRPALKARIFLAPLSNERGGPPRIMGCLQSVGSVGRAPRRFTVDRVQMRRIVASAPTRPTIVEPKKPNVAVAGFNETAAAFSHDTCYENDPNSARPHLRLVKSE